MRLERLSERLTDWSVRWVPDAYIIALGLTVFVGALAVGLTPSTPVTILDHWGAGFWALHSFAMQMCWILLGGYIVAVSPPVEALLRRLARLPRSSREAVALTAALSMTLAFLNWGLGLVASAFFTRALARERPRLNYPLVVAAAYLGMAATWHAGLSASAPLMVANSGNFLEKELGGVIPTSETIFHPFNLGLVGLTALILVLVATWLHSDARDIEVPSVRLEEASPAEPRAVERRAEAPRPRTPAERLEHASWIGIAFFAVAAVRIVRQFTLQGASLDLDMVNFSLLALGTLLHRTPHRFLRAAAAGAGQLSGIVIQFPLYAGIYGIIKYSDLQQVIAGWFIHAATRDSFPLLCYWYSGLLNYFIPSGGSKWAIEAPYMIAAAKALDVPQNLTVLAYAWGDMMTDAIQPFWAIPLLGIAGLSFREIMGYLTLFFVVIALLGSAAFYVAPRVGWF